ncbi:MAG: hypothetical protein EB015_19655 [Methylocystaceae bacterium]|jgi:hypothetical protein|nr:hypothetical protein [Methylocystaceae bacterium]
MRVDLEHGNSVIAQLHCVFTFSDRLARSPEKAHPCQPALSATAHSQSILCIRSATFGFAFFTIPLINLNEYLK